MFKNKKIWANIISSILVLGIAFGITVAYRAYINRNTEEGIKNITVNVIAITSDYDYEKTYEFETEEKFLGDVLVNNLNIVTTGDEGMRMITGVDDINADLSKEEWWKILINNQMGNVGMDEQPIKDGDVITLELSVGFD